MTTEELKNMELHQVLRISEDKDVMKVSTGWCYMYYEMEDKPVYNEALHMVDSYELKRTKIISTTFVPEEL